MKKIRYMYIIYTYRNFRYKKADLSFLNWIYNQCTLKHIKIIDKLWFGYWRQCYIQGNDMLWDFYCKIRKYRKFLYL